MNEFPKEYYIWVEDETLEVALSQHESPYNSLNEAIQDAMKTLKPNLNFKIINGLGFVLFDSTNKKANNANNNVSDFDSYLALQGRERKKT